jgi:signal transduction histidine kinase
MENNTSPLKTAPSIVKPLSLRWPIHRQLLIPMVSVVLLASFLATAITAYWVASRVRGEQSESLRRVAKTLGEGAYPLTRQTLLQMHGFSGAAFVLLSTQGRIQESTLTLNRPNIEELAQIGNAHSAGQKTILLDDRNYLVESVAVDRRSHFAEPATLFILYPEDQLTSRIHQAVYPALLAGVIAAAVAAACTTWLARRLARPIRTLVARTATIAQGDFTPMPMPQRNDELRDLSESINRMTSQLADYERDVRHNERLKTLGQLGASMAHQLRNAATGGRMAIELHRRDCPQGENDESLDVALRQMRLMEAYLRQFLSLGDSADGAPPAVSERIQLASLVEEVLGLVRPSCIHAGVELQCIAPAAPLFLQGDPDGLRQLATNLILNAVDAAVAGRASPPRVQVEITSSPTGGLLRVRDSGAGPPESIRDQLFHSFVTTKPDGFGLGLFVAHQIAERHRGRLQWRREGDWTCFEFEFATTT